MKREGPDHVQRVCLPFNDRVYGSFDFVLFTSEIAIAIVKNLKLFQFSNLSTIFFS